MANLIDENTIDIRLSVMVTGDPAVGKTSLIRRYAENKFSENYISTVGVDFTAKTIHFTVDSKSGPKDINVRYMIYDIGGQATYFNRIKNWAAHTSVFILTYDISSVETFRNVQQWYKKIQDIVAEITPNRQAVNPYSFVLVGTKRDLSPKPEKRKSLHHVQPPDVTQMQQKLGISVALETSAKTGENVEQFFTNVGQLAFQNHIIHNFNILRSKGIPENELREAYHCENRYYPPIL
jgi:small GTP-binding protein